MKCENCNIELSENDIIEYKIKNKQYKTCKFCGNRLSTKELLHIQIMKDNEKIKSEIENKGLKFVIDNKGTGKGYFSNINDCSDYQTKRTTFKNILSIDKKIKKYAGLVFLNLDGNKDFHIYFLSTLQPYIYIKEYKCKFRLREPTSYINGKPVFELTQNDIYYPDKNFKIMDSEYAERIFKYNKNITLKMILYILMSIIFPIGIFYLLGYTIKKIYNKLNKKFSIRILIFNGNIIFLVILLILAITKKIPIILLANIVLIEFSILFILIFVYAIIFRNDDCYE